MQTIERILKVDGSAAEWTDSWGGSVATPEIVIGIRAKLRFDLRTTAADEEKGILLPFDAANLRSDLYYIALDSDYLPSTDPRLLKLEGVTLVEENGRVYIDAEIPNTAVPGLVAAVGSGKQVELSGEIGGFRLDGSAAEADFAFQFPLVIRNRVWLGGEVPADQPLAPEYLTAEEVRALVQAYFRPESGQPGKDGASAYDIAVAGGYSGSETQWLTSLKGADGASAYGIAVAGGYSGSEPEWIASLKGATGSTGASAYEVAVLHGFSGSAVDWLNSLKGATGDALRFDKTGTPDERDFYDNEAEGFVFAAAVTDSEDGKTELQIHVKRSAAWADWCSPLVITYYSRNGKDGENAALIPPLEFTPPDSGQNYFYFSMLERPAATIAAVCIDTADGEYRLPYNSATGIEKILKKDGTFRVYFGARVPTYAKGRIYFAQGVAGQTQYQLYAENGGKLSYDEWTAAASLPPPPEDGLLYGICDGQWREITESGGGDSAAMVFDTAGTLAQRHVYDDAAPGFRYLATEVMIDAGRQEYQAMYLKRSTVFGDWSDPVRYYVLRGKDGKDGRDGENLGVIPDLEFFPETREDAPEGALSIIGGSVLIPGVAPVAAIELYDDEGNGIQIDRGDKSTPDTVLVRTCYAENHTIVYLGGELDVTRGGRIRFAHGGEVSVSSDASSGSGSGSGSGTSCNCTNLTPRVTNSELMLNSLSGRVATLESNSGGGSGSSCDCPDPAPRMDGLEGRIAALEDRPAVAKPSALTLIRPVGERPLWPVVHAYADRDFSGEPVLLCDREHPEAARVWTAAAWTAVGENGIPAVLENLPVEIDLSDLGLDSGYFRYRWIDDEGNESDLMSLPFPAVAEPTPFHLRAVQADPTGIKIEFLTEAQYNATADFDPATIYFIAGRGIEFNGLQYSNVTTNEEE